MHSNSQGQTNKIIAKAELMNTNIYIVQGNIVEEVGVDAIINAANMELSPGGGVCGAIYHAAGYNELNSECGR
jgi:O-acetyl-ADP-ribose deacetylase (regulator of RNase III)